MTTPAMVLPAQMELQRAGIGGIPTQVLTVPQQRDRAAVEAAAVLPAAAMRAVREAHRAAQDHRATEEHRAEAVPPTRAVRAQVLDKMHPAMAEVRMMGALIRWIRARSWPG